MIIRLLAAIMALLMLAGVCLAADKKALATDDAISDMVRLRLRRDPGVKGGALDAATKEGVVTLTGTVEFQRQKGKAARPAKKVKCAKSVVNNITLKDRTAK